MDRVGGSAGHFESFRKDDFEADWTKVAEGRFTQVYQVKLKIWREKCALKSYDSAICPSNIYRWDNKVPPPHPDPPKKAAPSLNPKFILTVVGFNNFLPFFFLHFFSRRVLDEVPDIAMVRFRYIVPIYGVCSEVTGVVMEYMSNGSLNSLLASHTLMWPKKFQMIHEASMGMNFLHSMKPPVLHLNLKTSNVLLDDHLHVKVRATGDKVAVAGFM